MGDHPTSIGHLDYLFAYHMYSRYPHLNIPKPDKTTYQVFQTT